MENDKIRRYWFKRRRYGYGWTPVTWQAWITVASFITFVLLASTMLEDTPRNKFTAESLLYMTLFVLAAAALIVVSAKKGPRPKWRWGSKPGDNPDEDI